MERLDTLIRGGKLVNSRGIVDLDIGIRDGAVCVLAAPEQPLLAARVIDARGRFVLPGCVDAHVHSREPGLAHKEDFLTLTRAAALGGITTIICQPNTVPPINNLDTFRLVVEDWAKRAFVDFGVQGMADSTNLAAIEPLLGAGAMSIELITAEVTGHLLGEILRTVHDHGGIAGVSVPDGGYSQYAKRQLQSAGRNDIAAWISAWPKVNEAIGVARVLLLTENTPYRFHLQMITTERAVLLLREAKQSNRSTFTVETSPHYLLLTEDDHASLGPWGMVHPRLKSAEDVHAVWAGILDGTIDMINTDHAPHARFEKESGYEDIWNAPPGIPGIELSLRLMLDQVNRGKLTLPKLTELMSEAQARRYGLYPQKGALDVGSDADIVIVDMEREQSVDNRHLVTAPKYSPFHGRRLQGTPMMTLLRGDLLAENGSVIEALPNGRFLRGRN